MAITLKANVRWGGVDYAPGATIPGLTPSDEAGLVSSNRAEWAGTPSTTSNAAVPVMATTGPGGGIASVSGDIGSPHQISIATRTTDAAANTPLVARFSVKNPTRINSISGTIAVRANGALIEAAIYNAAKAKVATTEQRECVDVGPFMFAVPETLLETGEYLVVLYCNNATPTFGVATQYGGFTAAGASMPMPATLGALTPSATVPALTIGTATAAIKPEFTDLSDSAYRIYGGIRTSKLIGLRTSDRKFIYTVDGGQTYTEMMNSPALPSDDAWIDAVHNDAKAWFLTKNGRIFELSGFTAGDTVTEVSCPTTPGLRRDFAKGRPYAMAVFQNYLLFGEYSTDGQEFKDHPTDPGGPRVLKYGPLDGAAVWSVSKEFTNHRHVHAFEVNWPSQTRCYVVLGDGISTFEHGLWRLTDIATNNWTRWTSMTGSYTRHHPVDICEISHAGAPAGLYGAGEGDGVLMTMTRMSGTVGSINVDNATPTPVGTKTSTTYRSIVQHISGKTSRNIYLFSAETGADEEPALFCVPPPYVQGYKVCDVPRTVPLTRSFIQSDYLLMFDRRYSVPLLPWQK